MPNIFPGDDIFTDILTDLCLDTGSDSKIYIVCMQSICHGWHLYMQLMIALKFRLLYKKYKISFTLKEITKMFDN